MNWQSFAPCASIGGDAWFPEDGENPTAARQVCASCPYQAPCLAGAVERGEKHGVWAGRTPREIRQIRRYLGLTQVVESSDFACVAGHEWASNTYVNPTSGKKACRACNREQVRKAREKAREKRRAAA